MHDFYFILDLLNNLKPGERKVSAKLKTVYDNCMNEGNISICD